MSRTSKPYGTCKLTGGYGQFVDSHLLPKALTRPDERGAPLLEGTKGKGFKRRWQSWSDRSLVIAEGEAILGRIDDCAIKTMRRHQLIWSSWVVGPPNFKPIGPLFPNHSIRNIDFDDPRGLWLYAVSLLWRAAASSNYAVAGFEIHHEKLELARRYITGEIDVDFEDFPVMLVQLSTKGVTHNHSPMLDVKEVPNLFGDQSGAVPMGRFYMNGLIIHVHLDRLEGMIEKNHDVYLGAKTTVVSCITYEASFQHDNLLSLAFESVFGPVLKQA